jgi:hypothetical protein
MKIRIIFYKAKWGDGSFIDNAINIWTWLISAKNREVGDYAHVEVHEADERGVFIGIDHLLKTETVYGTCWTSTMRGEDNGTVKRDAHTVLKHPDRWSYCEVEVSEAEMAIGLAYMTKEVCNNKGYSFKDTGKFFGLGILADKSRNICSEFCNNFAVKARILTGWGVISPRRLAYKLKQAGYEIKPLTP